MVSSLGHFDEHAYRLGFDGDETVTLMLESVYCASPAVVILDAFANLAIGMVESGVAIFVAVIIYKLAWGLPFARGIFLLMLFWLLLGIGRLARGGVITFAAIAGHPPPLQCVLLLGADSMTALCSVAFGVIFMSTITTAAVWFHSELRAKAGTDG